MDARKLLKLKKDFRDWCGVISIREIVTNPRLTRQIQKIEKQYFLVT